MKRSRRRGAGDQTAATTTETGAKRAEAAGWQFHSRVTIWKCPKTEMERTKSHGLLHVQLCRD